MPLAVCFSFLAVCSFAGHHLWSEKLAAAAESTERKARPVLLRTRVRFALADRKDISSRYIRVRHREGTLELAGFVPSLEQAGIIEKTAAELDDVSNIRSFWSVQYDLQERKPYKTRVGEQAADAALKAKILAALAKPRIQREMKSLSIQAIDVRHGEVRIYVVADAPSAETDLAKCLAGFRGITSIRCSVLKTYGDRKIS